jgi:hypothetical protein
MSRGVRLNNPGNVRISGAPWKGKVIPSRDREFETFDCPENGIRALAKTLLAYFDKHGLHTIREIISRWAPPTENNTEAYIQSVCSQTDIGPDDILDLNDHQELALLVEAIIFHENGTNPYAMEVIDRGIERAFA